MSDAGKIRELLLSAATLLRDKDPKLDDMELAFQDVLKAHDFLEQLINKKYEHTPPW